LAVAACCYKAEQAEMSLNYAFPLSIALSSYDAKQKKEKTSASEHRSSHNSRVKIIRGRIKAKENVTRDM